MTAIIQERLADRLVWKTPAGSSLVLVLRHEPVAGLERLGPVLHGEVHALVQEDERGRGVLSELMAAAMREAPGLGVDRIVMNVSHATTNPGAIEHLAEKHGFEKWEEGSWMKPVSQRLIDALAKRRG